MKVRCCRRVTDIRPSDVDFANVCAVDSGYDVYEFGSDDGPKLVLNATDTGGGI